MRPVTIKQWEKMPDRTKSWLVVKAFGFWTDVFWHIHKDYETEETLSGSIRNEQECRSLLKVAIKRQRVPKTAVVKRSLSYWGCAEFLHPGWEVAKAVLATGAQIEWIVQSEESIYCHIMREDRNCFVGWGKNLAEAICAAALKEKGLLIQK